MAPKSKTRNQKSIVLGVTGSIAAYKSAELASLLVKQIHNVFVVMSNDATEFITPLTLQTLWKNRVMASFLAEKENLPPRLSELADNADLFLHAPARSIDRVKSVITAGTTREPIDPVRFLSNRSSGKMGYAIASAAIEANHEVVLVSGPVNLPPPTGAKIVSVITSDEMHAAVDEAVRDCDVLVMCAAVSDYKPASVAEQKIKKRDEKFSLELIPARDILKSLPRSRNFFVVGFAAETNDVEEHARAKLATKNCDMMVANDLSDPK